MNHKYDRSWADLHGLPTQSKLISATKASELASVAKKPITPRHICILNKPNIVIRTRRSIVRVAKSVHLFLTTKYSWATSWQVAAR